MRTLIVFLGMTIFATAPFATASDEAKEISGMSIVGNDESPKSLFIVPWKSSEIGSESELTAKSLLDGSLRPIDKEVLARELDYFEIRGNK